MSTDLAHGGYGLTTRFNVTQHKYVGGEGGYCEMLEIHDAPEHKAAFVICQYRRGIGYRFWEYVSLDTLNAAWPDTFPIIERLVHRRGCIRLVDSPTEIQPNRPWFYVEDSSERIEGDFIEK